MTNTDVDPNALQEYVPDQPPPPQDRAPTRITVTPGQIALPEHEQLQEYNPDAAPTGRQVGAGESGISGAADVLTSGFAPAVAGVMNMGGPEPTGVDPWGPEATKQNIERLGRGTATLIHHAFSNHPDPEVQKAYEEGRKNAVNDIDASKQQHPWAFFGGQLSGALLGPKWGAMRGSTVPGRIFAGGRAGAAGGGLYGAGESISHGETSPGEVATSAAEGAGAGGLMGLAGGSVPEAARWVAQRAKTLYGGWRDPLGTAFGTVRDTIQTDWEKAGGKGWWFEDPEMKQALRDSGAPLSLVDVGGPQTKQLAQTVGNKSPGARQALSEAVGGQSERFRQQGERIGTFLNNMFGGARTAGVTEDIQQAARNANRPAYSSAYNAGDRPIWNPELERLTAAPAVQDAMRAAQAKWRNWQVRDGFGAANPPVTVDVDRGGILRFTGGHGIPTYPNIQFWDYAARHLAAEAEKARGPNGSRTEAALYGDLERQLKAALDAEVPEFQAARQGASGFFNAENALEAGKNFVMGKGHMDDLDLARAQLARMTPETRELFALGFANELADKFRDIRFDRNALIASFQDNPSARSKIYLALGPSRARQLEAVLHVERILDEARRATEGQSSTARQLKDMVATGARTVGHMGGGAVGLGAATAAYELHEGTFNPSHVIGAALVGSVLGKARAIDERVAEHIGQLLASTDPDVFRRGLATVVRNPTLFNALRNATFITGQAGERNVGPEAVGRGAAGFVPYVLPGLREGVHENVGSDHKIDAINDQVQP